MTLRNKWVKSQIKEISDTYPNIIDIVYGRTLNEYVFTVWFWVKDGVTGDMEKDFDTLRITYEGE